jgi:phage host-nuclease inhibitor protein Gam
MVLGLLKEMKFPDAIRKKEEVNKDELATWPAERLDLVGARRVPQDVFWYEVNSDRIADKD